MEKRKEMFQEAENEIATGNVKVRHAIEKLEGIPQRIALQADLLIKAASVLCATFLGLYLGARFGVRTFK